MKRAIIVHGWASHDQDGWFPWLKTQLEEQGFVVEIPNMPNPMVPVIKAWVGHLQDTLKNIDSDTIFIGHSIGCQTILRYLETIDTPIRGAVLVAGFFKLDGLRSPDERAIAKPWMDTPIDLEKVKRVLPRSIVILSDNDRFVPLEPNKQAFEEELGSEIMVDHGKKHFAGDQGITELPSALEAVKKLSA